MDVREKLVEMIVWIEDQMTRAYPYTTDQFRIETTVDHLIANGVTVQEWIPVAESPQGKGCYIVAVNHWLDGKPVTREAYWNGCDWLSCDKKRELTPRVTHWMPLPEPPKEDA